MVSKMSRENRAKQFMPFAALKGYPEALKKQEKMIVPRRELSEEYLWELNEKFQKIHQYDMVTVVYFCNREYLKLTGMVTKIDEVTQEIQIVNTKIPFQNIYELELKD